MMCNDVTVGMHIRRIFQYLLLFLLINTGYSKALGKYDECEQFLHAQDCYYFPCLDAHYSCGRDNHLARFSYDFCIVSTKKYFPQLQTNAKYYFNHTNLCTMMSVHDELIEEHISGKFTCAHLQLMVFNIHLNCFQNNQRKNQLVEVIDFCSIICENLQTIINMFLNSNSEYINLYQLLVQTGKSCGARIDESKGHTLPSLLVSICLDRKNVQLKQDITQIMLNARYEPKDYEWI